MLTQSTTLILRCVFIGLLSGFAALVHCANDDSGPLANLSFEHILPDSIQQIGYINGIAQDAAGFIWFGGSNGLARFDGYRLKIYRHSEQKPGTISHNVINSLILDTRGDLWIATEHGLNRYRPQHDDFESFFHPNERNSNSSSDDIRTIFEDSRGSFWLGTRGGLISFDRDNYAYIRYPLRGVGNDSSNDEIVWSLHEDETGGLWVATNRQGVCRLDYSNHTFEYFDEQLRDANGEMHRDVRRVFVDSLGVVWVGTYGGGVFRRDTAMGRFTPFSHDSDASEPSLTVWDFAEDANDHLLIGDGGALTLVDLKTLEYHRHSHKKSVERSPGNFAVTSLFIDRSGEVWAGFFPSGVDRIDRKATAFENFEHAPKNPDNSITDGGVIASELQSNGKLWIGTAYGLNEFDPTTRQFQHFRHNPDISTSISGDTILSVLEDNNKALWVGVWSGGLNKRLPNGNFKTYTQVPEKSDSLLGKEPWALMQDHTGQIWIGTEAGVNRYNPEKDNFERFLPRQDQMEGDLLLYTRALLEDNNGRIWVGSSRGLFELNPESHRFHRHQHTEGDPRSLSNDFVIALFQDSKQRIWVGTHGGGLNQFDPSTGKFNTFGTEQGLPDNVISGIIEDNNGVLWLSSQQGLSQFDPDTGHVRHFDKKHGLSGNLFNRNTPQKLSDGRLFFGNTKGFVLFDPEKLKIDSKPPPVYITEFRIFNKPIDYRQEDSPLTQTIETTEHVTVAHQDNMISFEFTALSYSSASENRYAYWLKGFDNDWVQLQNSRTATYTNLDTGNYELQVKAANADGVWSGKPRVLKLTVLPPLWLSTWAIAGYLLLSAAVIALLYRFFINRRAYLRERVANRRLKTLDKIKDEFLANTSHELRAPLNGMIGLAEALIADNASELNNATLQKLHTIATSGRRLSNLISDILDYSKLANRRLELHLQSVDLYLLCQSVINQLEPLAQGKPLTIVNALSVHMPHVEGDEYRLQQVLINLIGNAIKYTSEGFITISAEIRNQRVRLSVEDSGVGIAEEDLESIFMPFHKTDKGDDWVQPAGSGLGLTVCKKLIELHQGKISVTSVFGKGSEFVIDLPLVQDKSKVSAPRPKGITNPLIKEKITQSLSEATQTIYDQRHMVEASKLNLIPPSNAQQLTVLIVDDDTVNRTVLAGIVSLHNYQVIEAASGSDALTELEKNSSINLVLLDVIMPGLSGLETCKKIRERYSAQQLPVIFISANAQDKDLADAYQAGGSDFLLKPVSRAQLLPKIAVHLSYVTNS